MFGLITMLLSTLGATGMGSMLKILGGAFQGMSEAKAAKERRELIRDMQIRGMDAEFRKQRSYRNPLGTHYLPKWNRNHLYNHYWTHLSCRNHHFGGNHWILFHTRRA
jgi:hypothetical protein